MSMFPAVLDRISEIMVRDVAKVGLSDNLTSAAKLMHERGIGSVVVVDNDRVVGIVTERDFVRCARNACDPQKTTVADVMSRPVVTCSPDSKIVDAFVLMRKYNVHHLPIVEKDNRLVGIVTLRDLITVGKLIL